MGNGPSGVEQPLKTKWKPQDGYKSSRSDVKSNHQYQQYKKKPDRNYERNPRYLMHIGDEPRQMLRPIQGYAEKPLVTLEEACVPLQEYISDLSRNVWIAKKNSRYPADGLTPDESAAIHLYTMEWEDSLYIALNRRLREVDRRSLLPWFLFLKLLLTALFKLPSVRAVVWRGVVDDLGNEYKKGDEKVWWSFSSCTRSMDMLKNPMYLGGQGARTLFSIETFNGKDIKAHSFYKKEDEILLLPGTFFEITGNLPLDSGNDLHIIHLKQKHPPFVLLEPPFQQQHSTSSPKLNQQIESQATSDLFVQPLINSTLPPTNGGNLKKILFNNIPGSERDRAVVPNGYEGFNWENFTYVEESYAHSKFNYSWKNIFKYSRYGIYNDGNAKTMYIRSEKPGSTFTLVYIDATVVQPSNSEWTISGFKDNVKIYSKEIKFEQQGQYQFLKLYYADIDEIKFTTFDAYPVLFIGCIDIII